MSKADLKLESIKQVLKYHQPSIGNVVRVEKMIKNRYLVVTDRLNGMLQEHNGFYFLAYITDCDDDGLDDAIGLMVLTERTLVRQIQSHVPERTLNYWEDKMKSMDAAELEEDMLETYSILRHLQRKA